MLLMWQHVVVEVCLLLSKRENLKVKSKPGNSNRV